FLPGNGSTSYSDRKTFVDGEAIDFLSGRGQDNQLNNSGLKIQATVTLISPRPVPPSIATQPQDQTVAAGMNAAFSVVAHGPPQLFYQWEFNDAAIDGAT